MPLSLPHVINMRGCPTQVNSWGAHRPRLYGHANVECITGHGLFRTSICGYPLRWRFPGYPQMLLLLSTNPLRLRTVLMGAHPSSVVPGKLRRLKSP